MGKDKVLRVSVIREELVALAGDPVNAAILNQMLYWQERTHDVDKFIAEETARVRQNGDKPQLQPTAGWFYKTSVELADEIMMGIGEDAVSRRLRKMVERGWLDSRHDPKYKWDRKLQYRANIRRINSDLRSLCNADGENLGYSLQGWSIPSGSRSECIPLQSGMEAAPGKVVQTAPARDVQTDVARNVHREEENIKKNSEKGNFEEVDDNPVVDDGDLNSPGTTKAEEVDAPSEHDCTLSSTSEDGLESQALSGLDKMVNALVLKAQKQRADERWEFYLDQRNRHGVDREPAMKFAFEKFPDFNPAWLRKKATAAAERKAAREAVAA